MVARSLTRTLISASPTEWVETSPVEVTVATLALKLVNCGYSAARLTTFPLASFAVRLI
jgi:hypothetical protein